MDAEHEGYLHAGGAEVAQDFMSGYDAVHHSINAEHAGYLHAAGSEVAQDFIAGFNAIDHQQQAQQQHVQPYQFQPYVVQPPIPADSDDEAVPDDDNGGEIDSWDHQGMAYN